MNYDRTERIRRAAILVASLEETLAAKMLESLPPRDAEKVRAAVDLLGTVDPEEQEDVFEEFRRAGRRGRSAETAVEFTYSAPLPAPPPTTKVAEPAADAAAVGAATNDHSDADTALMAELLGDEHPQTIAAALSRLGHDEGAAVFASLPASIQVDVLDRLAKLEPGDEDAVLDLQSQLERRVQQQRQRRQRAAAAAEMARRMLEKTAPAQRATLLARLSPAADAKLASVEKATSAPIAAANQAQQLMTAARRTRSSEAEAGDERATPRKGWSDESHAPDATRGAIYAVLEDLSDELESLSDRVLLEALRLADERTVQRALVASSEEFLQRVAGKLPRRQAARLRRLVRSLGPTRLAELREAQHELLRIARECAAVPGADLR